MADVVRTSWIEPFEQETGVSVSVEEGFSSVALAKLKAQKGNPQFSVAMMDDTVVAQAVGDDLVTPLDQARIPNLANVFDKLVMPDNTGVGIGVSWAQPIRHTGKVPEPMSSWADLWDPQYKGHVAIPPVEWTLSLMLLAIASHLNTGKPIEEAQYDLDAGFEHLAELVPNLKTIYDGPGTLIQLYEQGEVWLSFFGSKGVLEFIDNGLPLALEFPKEGVFPLTNAITLVKGAPNQAAGEAFINWGLRPEVQLALAEAAFVGPVVEGVELPSALEGKVPYGDEDVENLIVLDWSFLLKEWPAVTERWNREIA